MLIDGVGALATPRTPAPWFVAPRNHLRNTTLDQETKLLTGIDPVLSGEIIAHLDAMGHSDAVVVSDAHFPAARLAHRWVDVPLADAPRLIRAIRTLCPLDDTPGVDLMSSAGPTLLPVQAELLAGAGVATSDARFLDRFAFYEEAARAYVVIRTGETRVYGNAILRKGIVSPATTTSGTGQRP